MYNSNIKMKDGSDVYMLYRENKGRQKVNSMLILTVIQQPQIQVQHRWTDSSHYNLYGAE